MIIKRRNDLNDKRNQLIAQARELVERAAKDERSMHDDEQEQYDKLYGEAEECRKQIETLTKQIEAERALESVRFDDVPASRDKPPADDEHLPFTQRASYRNAFRTLVTRGRSALSGDEVRALSVGTGSEGGFLVAPMELMDMLIKAKDDMVFIRPRATVERVASATSLGVPTLDADPDDADWTSELSTGSEDSTMAFGRRELSPHPVRKRIKVSRNLLRLSSNAENIVLQRLAYKFAITEEKAFLTGSGAGEPLGLFTASTAGVSTSRDVSTGNTSTAITMDGLINAKYACKGSYHAAAGWIFHRDGVKMIAKLRSDSGAGAGTGDYLWEPSKKVGEPDMLMGHPVYMSEYVPNTFTTGLYVGLFGDLSYYMIADAYDMQMQRLEELYAENNQVGFIGDQQVDGMPVLAEAFARVTLA